MDFQYRLILLSLLTACITSLAAFGLAATTYRTQQRFSRLWLLACAIAMGSIVWSAHFASILAFSLRRPASYELVYIMVSWLVMIATSCLALRIASQERLTPRLFVSGSVLTALGISGMYYVSAYGLRMASDGEYTPSLFSLFVSILATLSMFVLLILFWNHAQKIKNILSPQRLAAIMLPIIAAGLYYLATASTGFTPTLLQASLTSASPALFAMLITIGAIALVTVALMVSVFENRNGPLWPLGGHTLNGHNELSRMALLDTLTQLPNRRLFQQHLEVAIGRTNRMNNSLAVAFIDLDGFKPINDALGHHIGDQVLLAVAKRLNAAVRGCDVVARIGGDEFVALLEDIKSDQDIVPIVERIVQSLRDVFYIEGHEIAISASVGIAVYPRDGNMARLLVCADAAMYRAKSDGKNRFRFFDAEIELASDRLQEMQHDLAQALLKDEFKLHFQPKIDCKTNAITGVEALLRWQHPTKGMIAPGVFVPAAERFGLINQISDWVIEESCRIIHRLRNQGITLKVAINLSPQQFRNPNLVKNTLSVLQRFDLPSSSLMFEVVETADAHNQDQINLLLNAFREAGIDVAIGNFGAGISSLSYLQQANVSELKLDRTFINNIGSNKRARDVVAATIRLAHALKFRVVAEGVETEDQRKILVELDCDQQQGYLFARPVPEEKLAGLIHQLEALTSSKTGAATT
jgi:diguanylate cyclase (GGDEF)-like protein